jgi:transcriptional regulator with XRE-family HTH domain
MARFRVKELARAQGLTSEELAIRSGVKISTVQNMWQNRVKDPRYSTMAAIARTLGVSIDELVVADEDDNEPAPQAAFYRRGPRIVTGHA